MEIFYGVQFDREYWTWKFSEQQFYPVAQVIGRSLKKQKYDLYYRRTKKGNLRVFLGCTTIKLENKGIWSAEQPEKSHRNARGGPRKRKWAAKIRVLQLLQAIRSQTLRRRCFYGGAKRLVLVINKL